MLFAVCVCGCLVSGCCVCVLLCWFGFARGCVCVVFPDLLFIDLVSLVSLRNSSFMVFLNFAFVGYFGGLCCFVVPGVSVCFCWCCRGRFWVVLRLLFALRTFYLFRFGGFFGFVFGFLFVVFLMFGCFVPLC